ncbi:MAG: hypothetical protein GX600_04775 [Dehalococcoidia bacterium]|nr:hypothetical protein [Dehalococcoidia bacterium]
MAKHNPRALGTKTPGRHEARWLWLAGAAIAFVALGVWLLTPRVSIDPDLRAALIDQLSPRYPNEQFRASVAADVAYFGLPCDIFEGDEVDVDLYRGIGEGNYGVLVIRSHSGSLESGGAANQRTTALFTNERYAEYKHVAEQLNERVLIVRPFEADPVLTFGVAPSFFAKSMRGELPGTVVVVAGCSVLARPDLAQALVERGASVVVSWDRSVGLDYVDEAAALFVRHLLAEGMTVEEAAAATMAEVGADPEFGAVLKYYPTSAGRHNAEELLRR